jgi:hypothetical protein
VGSSRLYFSFTHKKTAKKTEKGFLIFKKNMFYEKNLLSG